MYRQLALACFMCLCASSQATTLRMEDDSILTAKTLLPEKMLHPIDPTYLPDVTETSPWNGHWFVSAGLGVNVFAGNPLGCGDIFDRMKPAFTFAVGKWFTPSIGGRIAFSGFQLKDACFENADYQSIHADFFWNIASYIYRNTHDPRWELSPYLGAGIIHNDRSGTHPFAFSYGFKGSYRMTGRLHLNLELGGTTTFRNFDGLGDSRKMGDNVLSVSAGLSVSIGKTLWKRVIDARPYMDQNDWLLGHVALVSERNRKYAKQIHHDRRVMAEMKKILEIEGLLETYGERMKGWSADSVSASRTFPLNDYSGYNSLMARIRNRRLEHKDNSIGSMADSLALDFDATGKDSAYYRNATPSDAAMWNDYLLLMSQNREGIGSPIYFFFQLNTAELTDSSQSLNIDEMARIAKKYDLRIRITGAADSATGSSSLNEALSHERASYIGNKFVERGIDSNNIVTIGKGGIADFDPKEVNRHTKVELFFEPQKTQNLDRGDNPDIL